MTEHVKEEQNLYLQLQIQKIKLQRLKVQEWLKDSPPFDAHAILKLMPKDKLGAQKMFETTYQRSDTFDVEAIFMLARYGLTDEAKKLFSHSFQFNDNFCMSLYFFFRVEYSMLDEAETYLKYGLRYVKRFDQNAIAASFNLGSDFYDQSLEFLRASRKYATPAQEMVVSEIASIT
jgi:hypothetical protein